MPSFCYTNHILYRFSISEMNFSAIPELVFMSGTTETVLIGFLDETFVAFWAGTDYQCTYFCFLV